MAYWFDNLLKHCSTGGQVYVVVIPGDYAVLKLVLGFTYVNSLKGLQNALHYYIILHILHT